MSLMVDGKKNKWDFYFFFNVTHHHLPARSFLCSLESRGEEKKERTQRLEQDNRQPPNALQPPRVPFSSSNPHTPARGSPSPAPTTCKQQENPLPWPKPL